MRSSHLKAVVKKELDSLSGSVRKPFWQYAQLDHDARFGNDYRIIWNLVIGRRPPLEIQSHLQRLPGSIGWLYVLLLTMNRIVLGSQAGTVHRGLVLSSD